MRAGSTGLWQVRPATNCRGPSSHGCGSCCCCCCLATLQWFEAAAATAWQQHKHSIVKPLRPLQCGWTTLGSQQAAHGMGGAAVRQHTAVPHAAAHHSAERQLLAALDHLGHAADLHHTLLELVLLLRAAREVADGQ